MIKPLNCNPPLDSILRHCDVGHPSSHLLVIVMINVTHSVMVFKLHLDVFQVCFDALQLSATIPLGCLTLTAAKLNLKMLAEVGQGGNRGLTEGFDTQT